MVGVVVWGGVGKGVGVGVMVGDRTNCNNFGHVFPQNFYCTRQNVVSQWSSKIMITHILHS